MKHHLFLRQKGLEVLTFDKPMKDGSIMHKLKRSTIFESSLIEIVEKELKMKIGKVLFI